MLRIIWGTKRRRVTTLVVAIALVIVSAAAAAWLVSSLGSGAGRFGTLSSPTLTPHDGSFNATADFLYPGTTGSLGFSITNDNPLALVLTSLSQNGAITGTGSCAGHVTFIPQSGLTIPIPAGTSLVKVPGALSVSASVPTECQGSLLTVPVSATFSTG